MNNARIFGIVIGMIVGILICLVIFRFLNRDRKLFTEYDEMQNRERGVGYKYSFYAVLIAEAVLAVLTSRVRVPATPFVLHFAVILFGVLVHVIYCIWHDAYVGLNTNLNRYIIIMTIISLFNLFIAFIAYREGKLIRDGILQEPAVNLFCGLLFAVIGIVAIMRKVIVREEE